MWLSPDTPVLTMGAQGVTLWVSKWLVARLTMGARGVALTRHSLCILTHSGWLGGGGGGGGWVPDGGNTEV